jgi:hypothetical protein
MEPSARGYNWATLFLGDINTGAWPSRLGGGLEYFHRSPVSRKRRPKGNPVVSDETVMFGYESSATLATDRPHYKLQTRPLVREGRKNTSTVIPASR